MLLVEVMVGSPVVRLCYVAIQQKYQRIRFIVMCVEKYVTFVGSGVIAESQVRLEVAGAVLK